jgi:hypothetical protein
MSVRDLDKLLNDHDYHMVYRGVDTHNMHKKIIREMENDFPMDISVLGMSYLFTLYNPAEDLFIIGAWVTQHDHYLRSQGEPARESLDWAVYNPKTRRIEDSNSFWEEEMGGYNNALKFILDYKDGYAAIDEN